MGCDVRGYQAFIAHNADGAERELRRRLRDVETLGRVMCKPEGTGRSARQPSKQGT